MDDLISRQTAIDEIARWIGYLDDDMIGRIQLGLKRLPSAESEDKCGECDAWNKYKNYSSAEPELATNLQQTCNQLATDCISRQAAIEAVCNACSIVGDFHKCDGYPEGSTWCEEITALRALPSAEPSPSDVARDIATIIENEKDMRVIAQPVRKGEWCVTPDGKLVCSCCYENPTNRIIVNGDLIYDMTPIRKRMKFCPNCGACMSRGEEDDT